MPATIRDVAKRAGVSVATVSRALNQSGPVRPETRRQVEAAAQALQYSPNGAARSLITRRTGILGVLLPDLYSEFFSELIRGIDEAAQARGYQLLLSSSHDRARGLEAVLRGMHGRVDGLIVMAPMVEKAVLEGLLPRAVPVVLLSSQGAEGARHVFRIDNYGGARSVVGHLVAHGHRRIAMIKGPAGNHDARERLRGYRAALRAAGLKVETGREVAGDFRSGTGHSATQAILRMEPRPTAIFAANDAMALGALSALRDAGVAVPEEVAVVGFDDVASTRYTIPPLTTVHIAISDLGSRAIVRLVESVNGDAPRRQGRETLPATVMIRRSCGCPAEEAGKPARASNDGF